MEFFILLVKNLMKKMDVHRNIHGFYKNTFSLEFLNLQCEVKAVHLKKENIVLRQAIVHK